MKGFTRGDGIIAALALVLCGVAAGMAGCSQSAPPEELVFVCEDDGALVERHVGVQSAELLRGYGSDVWEITYIDSRQVYYRHPEGETCYTEPAALVMSLR